MRAYLRPGVPETSTKAASALKVQNKTSAVILSERGPNRLRPRGPLQGRSAGSNQAVERNQKRFPLDFVFRLTPQENAALRSQNVISTAAKPKLLEPGKGASANRK
jgi:hypothetical protein